ncbi:MAG: hypothetical protein PVS3B3_09020 [Ktedonobacteraceae bacterium]
MLEELAHEETSSFPYRSKALSSLGQTKFSELLQQAIRAGNEQTLITSLSIPSYWQSTETYQFKDTPRQRRINPSQAAERLGLTEFNTWYVRGLAKKFLVEGVTYCQTYRAALPRREEHHECSRHEGKIFLVRDIYQAHRVRYWPEPGDPTAFSIPFGPGCHHTIRRYQAQIPLASDLMNGT